ncbi:MAG TPA: PepSY domain-containing protein [Solirubrobacteraceae bacterium]
MTQNVVSEPETVAVPDEPAADPAQTARGAELRAQPRPRLFRAVWRWHFYAGLLVIPIIVILSLSGIVYLFKPQIDSVFYGHVRDVDGRGPVLSYASQLAAVKAALPGASVTGVAPAPNAKRSTQFGVTTKEGRDWTVFVDPYTAKVLGHRDNQHYLPAIALDVHGSLLTSRFMDEKGKWGDRLIELATSWAVVLVVTGMYLWWPRGRRRSLRQALTPRLRARSLRVRWRDVHAITGVAFSFVFLFFLVTGLAWSGVWGQNYKNIATKVGLSYPPGTFDGVPSKTVEDVVKGGKAAWAAGSLPVAQSVGSGRPGHTGHNDHARVKTIRWNPKDGAPLDAVVARAKQMGMAPGTTIAFPAGNTSSYAVGLYPDNDVEPNQSALNERFAFVDQYTAKPVGDFRYSQFGVMAQATDLGIALHEGRQFGLVNQIGALLATLALLLSCASAIVMWRKRRPKGIGAPRRAPNRKLGAGVVAITLGLGLLFPLLGISILVLLVFDFVIVKHVAPLRRALGAV